MEKIINNKIQFNTNRIQNFINMELKDFFYDYSSITRKSIVINIILLILSIPCIAFMEQNFILSVVGYVLGILYVVTLLLPLVSLFIALKELITAKENRKYPGLCIMKVLLYYTILALFIWHYFNYGQYV